MKYVSSLGFTFWLTDVLSGGLRNGRCSESPLTLKAVIRSKLGVHDSLVETRSTWLENLLNQMNQMNYKQQSALPTWVSLLESSIFPSFLQVLQSNRIP